MPNEWLLFVELVEISYKKNFDMGLIKLIEYHLSQLARKNTETQSLIEEGLRLAHAKY